MNCRLLDHLCKIGCFLIGLITLLFWLLYHFLSYVQGSYFFVIFLVIDFKVRFDAPGLSNLQKKSYFSKFLFFRVKITH